MSKVSCINNPLNERLIIIREWQVRACEGDCCAAALLNLFAYWHDVKLDKQSKIKYLKPNHQVSENDLLQWHTSEDLKLGLLDLYADKKIRKSIKLLVQLGFISVRRNPNQKYKYDQTKFFLFNPSEVNKWLEDNSYQKGNIQSAKRPNEDDQNVIDHPAKRLIEKGQNNHLQLVKRPNLYTEITNRDYKHKLHTKKNNEKFLNKQQREEFLDEEYLRMREETGSEKKPTPRCDKEMFAKFDAELRELENKKREF